MAVDPSTFSTLISFPGEGSIPPPCFYNMGGLAAWLNNHPSYKLGFSYTGMFAPYLIPPNLVPPYLSTLGTYKQENVPLCNTVTTLSQQQGQKYKSQLNLFYKVYSTNYNEYINYASTGQTPIYYQFTSYNEKYEYNAAVQLVNKMYNFNAMATASSIYWQIPFPVAM